MDNISLNLHMYIFPKNENDRDYDYINYNNMSIIEEFDYEFRDLIIELVGDYELYVEACKKLIEKSENIEGIYLMTIPITEEELFYFKLKHNDAINHLIKIK